MKFGVVVFPGTWSDVDCFDVIKDVVNAPVEYVWHKDTDLSSYDCIILPGGFSYGDYLRCGAIARFSPVMGSVIKAADEGKLIIGICNGFQILCESGLLPGVLRANDHLQFRCQWTDLRVENAATPFTSMMEQGQVIGVPISHGEGNYYADPETIAMLERDNRVAFRYCGPAGEITSEFNPNGSLNNIAGITNPRGNVLGMMPHPERCCDVLLGGVDGAAIFQAMASQSANSTPDKVQETTA